MPTNLAQQFLQETQQSIVDFEDVCCELADEFLVWLDHTGRTAIAHKVGHHWIERRCGAGFLINPRDPRLPPWGYHVVVSVDDVVHDAWHPEPLPLREYIVSMFADPPTELEINTTLQQAGSDRRQFKWLQSLSVASSTSE